MIHLPVSVYIHKQCVMCYKEASFLKNSLAQAKKQLLFQNPGIEGFTQRHRLGPRLHEMFVALLLAEGDHIFDVVPGLAGLAQQMTSRDRAAQAVNMYHSIK